MNWSDFILLIVGMAIGGGIVALLELYLFRVALNTVGENETPPPDAPKHRAS